ncbi:hypothetical protein CsSME_00047572 [Camellia sinensis var. sinensis]
MFIDYGFENDGCMYVDLWSSCYEGESLAQLIKSIQREMESARLLDTTLPHKIWIKQQFSVGVNDVTHVLERMPPVAVKESSTGHPFTSQSYRSKAPPIQLQAILLASDCNPRWLMRHLPSMASSRKVKGNAINQCIEEILHGNEINFG